MLGNEIIYLISNIETTNTSGDVIKTPTKREVFADRLSVGQSEFYQAAAKDLKPELKFDIQSIEYQDESFIEWKDKTYKIIRTYNKGLDKLELTCSGIVNGVM
jgi:hypothetical protein